MSSTVTSTEQLLSDQLAVRDDWRRSTDDSTVNTSNFHNLNRWIMERVCGKTTKDFPAIDAMLKRMVSPDYLSFQPDMIRAIIGKNSYGRCYRITSASDHRDVTGDMRLRSVVDLVLADNTFKFPWMALTNAFFTHLATVRLSASRVSKTTPWGTNIATTFEKLMQLCFLIEYAQLIRTKTPATNSNTGAGSKRKASAITDGADNDMDMVKLLEPQVLQAFLRRDGNSAQRTGRVIQTITRGWDRFAQSLHYDSVEQMLLPYLHYGGKPFRCQVLQRRDDGYMPLSVKKFIDADVQPVYVPLETFPGATDFNTRCDAFLRTMAVCYLNDLRRNMYSNTLYANEGVRLRDRLLRFEANPTQIPKRFDEFSDEDMEAVRAARRSLLSIAPPRTTTTTTTTEAGGPSTMGTVADPTNTLTVNYSGQSGPSSTHPQDGDASDSGIESGAAIGTGGEIVDWFDSNKPDTIPTDEVKRRKLFRTQALEAFTSGGITNLVDDRRQVVKWMSKHAVTLSCPLSDMEDVLYGESFDGAVFEATQLVLIDPPFNVRKNSGRENAQYDHLSLQDMDEVVVLIDRLLRPGGHAVIFCSIQQFPTWEHKTFGYKRSEELGEMVPHRGPVFMVDRTPLVLVNHPKRNNNNPARASCSIQSNVEFALHLKKNGLGYQEEATMVNYRPFNFVASSFPATKNVIDNIYGLTQSEAVMVKASHSAADQVDASTQLRSATKLRAEQKPILLLQELISRFSQPGDVVVDFFAGTFSTAAACLTLPNHRRFVGCEKDNDCFKQAQAKLVNRFAEFVSDHRSVTDFVVPDDILLSCSRLFAAEPSRSLLHRSWAAPSSLPQFQRFPIHIMNYMSGILQQPRFIKDHFLCTVQEWPPSIKQTFDHLQVNDLLQVEGASYNVVVAPSTIKHPMAGKGLFAGRSFDVDDVICYYYGTLVYTDLENETSKTRLYGDAGLMGVSGSRFRHYAMQVKTSGTAFNAVQNFRHGERSVFVVPPPFCVASYINDYRYEAGDEDFDKYNNGRNSMPNVRLQNVAIFQQHRPVSSLRHIASPEFLPIRATRPITRGEELFVDYGRPGFALSTTS